MTRARGYTVVEVMIAMAVLAVGTTGVMAMQKVAAASNREARNLVLANQIARSWIDRLRADAFAWNTATDLPNDTVWLQGISNNSWFRPNDDPRGSPAADAFGNDVVDADLAGTDRPPVFCTNLRLGWLYPIGQSRPAIRAEVRVFWLREGAGGDVSVGANTPLCARTLSTAAVTNAPTNYHFVYVTSAILQNTIQ
jgi:prepilin-type N-terminal cleavage/methylation domain-containing protein